MNQLVIGIICIAGVVMTSGCSIAKKVGAGVVLPFAALSDTLVALPLSGTDAASKKLIKLGDEHVAHLRVENKDKVTAEFSENTALVYYVPGYGLRPIGSLAPPQLYPLTKSCLAVFEPVREQPIKDALMILPKKKQPVDEFEIW